MLPVLSSYTESGHLEVGLMSDRSQGWALTLACAQHPRQGLKVPREMGYSHAKAAD